MRSILYYITAVAWGLWFGGLVATFVFAGSFFSSLPHDVAAPAASRMFVVFGKYELALAGVAILATGLVLVSYPSTLLPLLLLSLIAAGGCAVMTSLGFTPFMESLRAQGKTQTVAFERLHHKSVIVMTTQAGILLLTGGLLIASMNSAPSRSEISAD